MTKFSGRVDESADVRLDRPRDYDRHRASLTGQRVTLTLVKEKSKRSLDQNAWLWGVALPMIADHCGYEPEEQESLHYDLLAIRFGTKAIAPLVPDAPPRIVPTTTSSQLDTKAFSDYMDWIVRFAAKKFGINIPLPDEVPL